MVLLRTIKVGGKGMKVIYVAGPFRAENAWEIEQNIRRAETLALEVWRAGFAAICPHTNTRFFQGAAPDEVWLQGDISILNCCDGIIMVPGWETSKGAKAEEYNAKYNKIPRFYDINELIDFDWDQWDDKCEHGYGR